MLLSMCLLTTPRVCPAAIEQATAELDRMAVDDTPPTTGTGRRADGASRGGGAANGPSSSAQPPDRPRSRPPSAPASGSVAAHTRRVAWL